MRESREVACFSLSRYSASVDGCVGGKGVGGVGWWRGCATVYVRDELESRAGDGGSLPSLRRHGSMNSIPGVVVVVVVLWW